MRESFRAKWVPVASIAILVLFFAPLTMFETAPPERYVLADISSAGIAPVMAVGATIVEQYEQSLALLRVTAFQAAELWRLGVPHTDLTDRTVIDFSGAGYRFDTAGGVPVVPVSLRADRPSTYIVQFIGPIKSEWTDQVQSLGGTLSLYTPNYAYLVRMSPPTVQAVRGLPFVTWVGPYEPAYKIPTSLQAATGSTRIMAVAYNDVSVVRFASEIQSLGGTSIQVTTSPRVVQAVIDGSRIPDVARLEDTQFIFPDEIKQTLDYRAGIVHGFHSAWYKETSGLPYTLTGVSNGPDGIRGTADDIYEIAGISDTGLDEGSAANGANDFFQGPLPTAAQNDRVIRFTDHTGCSVPDGLQGGRVAHGSHVAGIVASNGYSWEKYLVEDQGRADVSLSDFRWDQSEAGVAPEAKITFDGVNGCSGGVFPSPQYWLDQYNDGARVMVNSWGGSAGNYSGSAFTVDSQMDDVSGTGTNDRMIEFSAANGGPDYNTLSGDAQGKNGLSIGASENFRPDQFDADNPDLLASFSSKGGPLQSWGRIKPDLVAIGTAVVSLFARGEWEAGGMQIQPDYIMQVDKYSTTTMSPGSDGIPDYRYLQGTSMSGPMAAGLYLLAREYLREVRGIANPNSQLIKAYLINGAVRMNPSLYAYPGWDQGWGRIDLPNSLFPSPPATVQSEEGQLATTGGTWTPAAISLNVASGTVPLKITLVWIDAPSAPLTNGRLVRDLNLQVTSPSGAVYCGNNYVAGWSAGFAGPGCGAGNTSWDQDHNGWDEVNNVERVEVERPETGTWSLQVRGFNVPSTAKFALVVSADVGATSQYRVDLATDASTILSVAQSGSANLPFRVTNYGTAPLDHVALSAPLAPAGVTVRFSPVGPVGVSRGKSVDDLATIEVAAGVQPKAYEFCLVGTSNDDPNPAGPSSDSLCLRLEVTTTPLPDPIVVANGTTDEFDPSIVVFNTTAGERHIFIAYRKTLPVALGGKLGGVNVWVAHTTLDNSGMPILPFQQASVSSANDQPNDLRLLRIPSGTYQDRVVITWTGTDPNVTNQDLASYGRMAWADPPYSTWNLVILETNRGSSTQNVARVSFPLFRRAGGGAGELIWVWEHLDYLTPGQGNPTRVQSHAIISTTGGVTWGAPILVLPRTPTETNFYFFPHGTVDQNDVVWIFAYFRTPTGNDRDLAVRLYDGAWSGTAPVIWNTVDNIQWPFVLSTAEGAFGNRVYVAVTRDNLAVDLKLWMVYIDGTATPWSSSNVPRAAPFIDNCGPGCAISLDFAGPFGPFGLSASNANYNRRPILNLVETVEGATHYVWLPYMENNNPYGTPNLWTFYGQAGDWSSGSLLLTKVTADGYAKGHQMTDTLTTSGLARLYEVYHSSRTPMTSVNYNIYLAIYSRNWETAADTVGPVTTGPASVPSLVDLAVTTSMRISANVNDMSTGNSTIAGAEFFFDTLGAPGTGRALVASDGTFDSSTEGVQILAGVPPAWISPSCHAIYIRGQDAPGNWGEAAATQVCIEGTSGPDLTPPVPPTWISARLLAPTFGDVELRWRASPDEGFSGGTTEYRVFRAPAVAGPWTQLGPVVSASGRPDYTVTDTGVGSNTYYYKIEARDGANNTANTTRYAGRTEFAVASGLNFLSYPFEQYDESLLTVFQTFNARGAWTYDGFSRTWKTYSASRPMGQNDLQRIGLGTGVYVDVGAAGTFAVAGLLPTSTNLQLYTGWNFVGYPTVRTGYTVANLKADTAATLVLGFAPGLPGNTVILADSAVLMPGAAYWVKCGGTPIWIVPGY